MAGAFPFPLADVEMSILDRMDSAFQRIESRCKQVERSSKKGIDATRRLFAAKYTEAMARHTYHYDTATEEDPESEPNSAPEDDEVATVAELASAISTVDHDLSITLAEKADAAVAIMEDWLANLEAQSLHRFYATVQFVEDRYAEFASLDSFRTRLEGAVARVESKFVKAGSTTRDATLVASRAVYLGARRLLHFEELPVEWQENEYITSGYRFLHTKAQCLGSIFQFHNETGNIWTHLLGLVFFLALAVYELAYRLPAQVDDQLIAHASDALSPLWVDRLIFLFFFAAACKCLFCSTMYHTFCHHSHLPTMRCAVMLDYIGISILITASTVVVDYYGFYCATGLRNFYLFFTVLIGATGVVLSSFPWFDYSEYRYIRVTVFVLMSASGFLPLLHLAYDRGLGPTGQFIAPVAKSLMVYGTGVYFYAKKYPERLYPGLFDNIGNSHQLWHVCVVGGIYLHYMAALQFHQSRYTFGCSGSIA